MRMEPWEQIRQALIDCSPEKEISEEQPDTRRLPFYFPTSRFRAALQHDNYLILGDRGAGKTMLFRVLDENAADIFGNSDVQGETRVGFARRRRGAPMPQAEDLSKQLAGAEVPRLRLFWLGLLGHSVLKELHGLPKELVEALQHPHDVGGWLPLVEHHSTVLSNALDALDTELATEGRWRFFLYDDLDLLMPTWPELFAPLRGLFGLWQSRTRTWRRLRPKIFLRQDIFQSSLLAFPDGAKFFAAHQVELSWSPAQLFALLLKRLLNLGEGRPHSRPDNPENDPAFQRWLQQHTEGVSIVRKLSIGQVPTPTEQFGPRLMAALAGPQIGRASSYDWLLQQLADGRDQTSPRAFLRLFRLAAEFAQEANDQVACLPFPRLHAAQLRVSTLRCLELQDEDPWLAHLRELLRDQRLPMPEAVLDQQILLLLQPGEKDPPPLREVPDLRSYLLRRGLFFRREDGKYEVPELYRHGLGLRRGGEPDNHAHRAPLLQADVLRDEVARLFCRDSSPYGGYHFPDRERGEVLVPGMLYRIHLVDSDQHPVSLQLYKGIDALGGEFWSREVRALMRLSAENNPALPTIRAGAYDDGHDLAFVITETSPYSLAEPEAMAHIAADPLEAFRQFTLLTHALGLLHEQGIVHRHLMPASIDYVQDRDDERRYSLRLARFEMSSMISNLLRRQLAGRGLPSGDIRAIYLDDLEENLPYCPPERAAWLLSNDNNAPLLETDRSDVYALGVLAWRWLVEPLLGAEAPQIDGQVGLNLQAVQEIHRRLRLGLRQPQILPDLADLLGEMLEDDPRSRPAIADVLQRLCTNYGRIAASLAPRESGIYHAAYMPAESKSTIQNWGWITQDPETETGREELRVFLAEELRSAELLYAPEGFFPYQPTPAPREADALRAARYVLVGRQAYWFCTLYTETAPAFRVLREEVEQVLLIKYVREHGRAWRLGNSPLRRRIPGELKLLPVWRNRSPDLSGPRRDGASWKPLLQSIEFKVATPAWLAQRERALEFLVQLRQVEVDAHCYPYVRDPGTQKVHLLRWDQERNRRYQIGDALRNLYFQDAQLRPPLGRFFAGLDSEQTVKLQLFADKKDWPDFQDRQEVFLEAVVGDDSVEVRLPREVWDIPERGWIRPAEDQGNAMQLRRQKEATQSLRRSGSLMSQLHHPQAVRGFRQPWAQAGRHLRGKGAEIVRDMLCSEPFFALHGPPGTGKTTVAAEAVATTLRADPTRRILISSQSHYALDNLAQRVLGRCRKGGIDVVAIRIASDYAVERGKIPLQMERYLPEKLAESKVNSLLRDLPEWQRNGELRDGMRLTPLLKALLGRWQEQVKRVEGEIRDRLRRGANLVFATTGACTPEKLSNGTLFDWVIVEEAARAWPTELAMPLILGRRWTLIGDHFQLPAFDEQRVEKVLQLCKEQGKDEDLLAHGEQRQTYMQSFRLFGNLFDQRAERRRNRPSGSRLVEPLDELDLQFRMHPDIAAVVARAFYRKWINPDTGELVDYPGGWLQSDTETEKNLHNFQRPPFLRGRALLWLNTDGMPDSDDIHAWKNEAEVGVIRALLQKMNPPPDKNDEEAFALLTPYLAQKEALEQAKLPPWAQLHTVDSFQGREADTVVVSLVRATHRRDDRPEANIGYLVSPNRLNVLLSRARKLLVIVGKFSHFEQQVRDFPERKDIYFWRDILDEFRREKEVPGGSGRRNSIVSANILLSREEQ